VLNTLPAECLEELLKKLPQLGLTPIFASPPKHSSDSLSEICYK